MRYLNAEQLHTSLSLGKSVEQWLSHETNSDCTILKWLRIDKEKDYTYSVSYMECFDEGSNEYIDIYSFSTLDPDEPCIKTNFKTIDETLHFAITSYCGSITRFVSAGMIQEEYKDYLNQSN